MNISLTDPYAAEQLRANHALMQVLDPELHVNIIDLGLVYEVLFSTDKLAIVNMTLSTPYCPMGDAIIQAVRHVMEETFPGWKVDINLVWDPEWNYDRISEAGKEQLNMM